MERSGYQTEPGMGTLYASWCGLLLLHANEFSTAPHNIFPVSVQFVTISSGTSRSLIQARERLSDEVSTSIYIVSRQIRFGLLSLLDLRYPA